VEICDTSKKENEYKLTCHCIDKKIDSSASFVGLPLLKGDNTETVENYTKKQENNRSNKMMKTPIGFFD